MPSALSLVGIPLISAELYRLQLCLFCDRFFGNVLCSFSWQEICFVQKVGWFVFTRRIAFLWVEFCICHGSHFIFLLLSCIHLWAFTGMWIDYEIEMRCWRTLLNFWNRLRGQLWIHHPHHHPPPHHHHEHWMDDQWRTGAPWSHLRGGQLAALSGCVVEKGRGNVHLQ